MTFNYQAYLESEAWQLKRSEVFKRSNGQCEARREEVCMGRAFQVHHLTYERVGHELLEDLQAVCTACHSDIHGKAYDPYPGMTLESLGIKLSDLRF